MTAKKVGTTAKTKPSKAQEPKAESTQAVKAKVSKPTKTGKSGGETADHLPATIEELKATNGGLVCYLFLSGNDKAEIAKELKTAFGLGDTQAVKIVRRITGRARFFRWVFDCSSASGINAGGRSGTAPNSWRLTPGR
jgi:hypothetical protein